MGVYGKIGQGDELTELTQKGYTVLWNDSTMIKNRTEGQAV
jgi:hypothetical protein